MGVVRVLGVRLAMLAHSLEPKRRVPVIDRRHSADPSSQSPPGKLSLAGITIRRRAQCLFDSIGRVQTSEAVYPISVSASSRKSDARRFRSALTRDLHGLCG